MLVFDTLTITIMKDKDNQKDAQVRLSEILETVVDAIICIDSNGKIDLFNSAAVKMFGYRADEIIGKNVNLLMPEPFASEHDEYIARYERTGEKRIIGIGREIEAKRRNGEIFPIELAVSEAKIDGKRLYTGIIRDITHKKEVEKEIKKYQEHLEELVNNKTRELTEANLKLEELANVDGLTGISNRRIFDEVLDREVNRAIRKKSVISLIMCDIDYFKLFNDHYGHVSGDDCLRKLAGCLQKIFMRATDLAARYGGEEFAVILPDTDLTEAKVMAEKLIESVEQLSIPHEYSKISDHITISVGLACVKPVKDYFPEDLIKKADKALYGAKGKGRNRIEIFKLD